MRAELQAARRNFPRAEYELVKDSFPEKIHSLSSQRLNSRIVRCERLIQSYKVRLLDKGSLHHIWRGSGRLNTARLIRYRMNHLSMSLEKFKAELRKSAEAVPSTRTSRRGLSEESHELTSQPKMRLSRKSDRRGRSLFRERQRRDSTSENTVNPAARSR